MRQILLKKFFFIFLIVLFFSLEGFSQTIGDYRSSGNGNWTTLSSWQYYNGSAWVTPSGTSPQGYPGQFSGTGAVLIQSGHSITIGTGGITTQTFGILTISGTLVLNGINTGGTGTNYNINTSALIVTSGLTPVATINFQNKVNLKLPANTPVTVSASGLSGDCSNNQDIYIGTVVISYCQGGGGTPTFEDIMDEGGYYVVNVSPESDSSCGSKTFSFKATAFPSSGSTIKWYTTSTGGTAFRTIEAGTDTFSPTLSTTTTYYVEASYSGYTTSRKAVTAMVNSIVSPTLSAVTQPTCSVSNGSFTISNYNASYTYSATPSTGVTISGNTVTAPTGSYTITATSGGCTSVASSSVTVNTQPTVPSAPIIGTVTQPNCTLDTGSVMLSGLPTGTWTLVRSGSSSATITGTGASTTVSGLVDGGNYSFTVSNGSCTSAPSDVVSIDAISTMTSTWNGSVWINNSPDNSKRIVFAGNFSSTENITGCSCKVTSGANVVINSGHTLTITNGVDVQTNGSLTFENTASLVQTNDAAVNSGSINYKRHTAAVKRYDFTYWSSPVSPQTLKDLSPNTLFDKYYSYDPSKGWVISYNGVATMEAGKGYLVRAPQTFSITAAAIDTNPVFIGKPNNGIVSFSITGNQVHLLGNPYPSAIDADAFLDANSTVLAGTLYFWTHNSAPSSAVAGNATYNYTVNDYATYNRTGGVSTASAAYTGIVAPTGKIAAGQGFFAPASTAGGTVVFNNSMRLSSTGTLLNNSQFFKLSSSSKSDLAVAKTEKNRLWLNLTNKQGAFKQMLVGYITGATNDYDGGFDGVTYDGNAFVDFYSVNNTVNLSIQGRALPFEMNDSVALGYKSTIKGEFQISIDHTDGVLSSQSVFVEDKVLNVLHNLKKGAYTFTTEIGSFNNRFVLRYVDKNASEEVVEPEVPEVLHKEVLVSVQNDVITVNSPIELLKEVVVYDVTGKKIYQKSDIDANELLVEHLKLSHQVLVVDVFLSNGTKINRKIVY